MKVSSTATIDPAQLDALLDSGAPPRLLDVRTPTEFQMLLARPPYNRGRACGAQTIIAALVDTSAAENAEASQPT